MKSSIISYSDYFSVVLFISIIATPLPSNAENDAYKELGSKAATEGHYAPDGRSDSLGLPIHPDSSDQNNISIQPQSSSISDKREKLDQDKDKDKKIRSLDRLLID